jgi:hypothetical protein
LTAEVARTEVVEENTRGAEKRNVTVKGHEVTRVLANGVGVTTAQVKQPVLMRTQITE